MNPIEPELIQIPAGPVLLSVPTCPAGSTLLHRWGSPRSVEVAAFKIAAYSVTRREYDRFLQDTGHVKPADWNDPILKNPDQPACGVSAEDADVDRQWINQKTGKPYRIPHADEWEKAARGGLEGRRFSWGDEDPVGRCCFGLSSQSGPHVCGSFPPNGYGLYDMVGNVWQWLADLFADVADDQPVNTPTGKAPEINRVLVGGSFMTPNPDPLWVAYRHDDPPDLRHRCLGFRLAM